MNAANSMASHWRMVGARRKRSCRRIFGLRNEASIYGHPRHVATGIRAAQKKHQPAGWCFSLRWQDQ
jgi:hypothetical protein